jgi:hypothetical protein
MGLVAATTLHLSEFLYGVGVMDCIYYLLLSLHGD